ncbi:hypothetical protein [Roseibacillus ishigakijimensis]|uniref:Uncharacterized protein n=1 Tax=Roseibacillus ishigakijimensis TaxID=454146 RepID=A0A934RUG9_9BACT|nr:hypothetical protein [Roseibacillus ishigakijimensis]MBK1834390.1 hypothetical protein [Roseibacillus ishigakijimensis]
MQSAPDEETPTRKELPTVRLTLLDWGQVQEGLSCRQEEWQATADWHSGRLADLPDGFKEVRDAEEAQWIADNYQRILALIESQLEKGK